jgi:hypothetical protein
MSPLAIPGTLRAYDDLRDALTLWTLAEQAFNGAPNLENAQVEHGNWRALVTHAINCGMADDERKPIEWITRRAATYAKSIGAA